MPSRRRSGWTNGLWETSHPILALSETFLLQRRFVWFMSSLIDALSILMIPSAGETNSAAY